MFAPLTTEKTAPCAWMKHIPTMLRELATPLSQLGQHNEPNVHHGSSTWFKLSPTPEPWLLLSLRVSLEGLKTGNPKRLLKRAPAPQEML